MRVHLVGAFSRDVGRVFGGEGGIRTRQDRLESVTYKNRVAAIAMNASDAVAPCPPLPADVPPIPRHLSLSPPLRSMQDANDVDRVVADGRPQPMAGRKHQLASAGLLPGRH